MNAHTTVKRPISEKIGLCLWPYSQDMNAQIKACHDIGMKYISCGVFLNPPDFSAPSDLFKSTLQLCKAYGMHMMVNFTSFDSNSGFSDDGFKEETQSYYSSDMLEKIKNSCLEIYQVLKGGDVVYEGWNEPNGGFWSPKAYWENQTDPSIVSASTAMEIWLAKQGRNIDQTATFTGPSMFQAPDYDVVYGGGGNNRKYVNMTAQFGLYDVLDAVCIHPYMQQSIENGSPELLLSMGKMKVTNLPLVSNEFGFFVYDKSNGNTSWQGAWNPHTAAALTLRQILIMDLTGYSIIAMYGSGGGAMGVTSNAGNILSTGKAMQWLLAELNGYTLDSKIEVTAHNGYIDDLYVLKYTKDGASNKIVYWTPSRFGESCGTVVDGKFVELFFTDYPQIKEMN
ncbi:hypothetical protein KBX49_09125 [Liquorilactobacillus satsumensis]|uniref:hypothetical protein n=1 Tax=Liquorilactobacillus satsumensis TaxID=259059 RepID=UPI0021C3CD0B|nr:hypothetical protein [Liquorilactobacillus satsumensis]MCP9357366.1 hypothetical protein [Liquorilactobacillus satsumensis]MCP9372074.1 hypothetical protein [Liquorilactobacillus satsumensis]